MAVVAGNGRDDMPFTPEKLLGHIFANSAGGLTRPCLLDYLLGMIGFEHSFSLLRGADLHQRLPLFRCC